MNTPTQIRTICTIEAVGNTDQVRSDLKKEKALRFQLARPPGSTLVGWTAYASKIATAGCLIPLNLSGKPTTLRTQGSTFHVPSANSIANGTGLFFNNTDGGSMPSYRDPPGAAITASDVTCDYDEV